jgi:hypothetical protein
LPGQQSELDEYYAQKDKLLFLVGHRHKMHYQGPKENREKIYGKNRHYEIFYAVVTISGS